MLTAYLLGRLDYYKGYSYFENPFYYGEDNYFEWREGWIDAEYEDYLYYSDDMFNFD